MTLSRNQFFLLAILLCLLAAFSHRLWWVLTARHARGEIYFIGHGDLGSSLGISTYEVIRFVAAGDTITFNNDLHLRLHEGQPLDLLYHPSDPHDAKVNSFKALWAAPLIYAMWPLLVLLVLYFLPDVFPRDARLIISRRRFFKLKRPA